MKDKANVEYRFTMRNKINVRFHEVDAYKIVHNVHYFNYFDIGRFALVDRLFRKEDAKDECPYLFLVLRSDCKFVYPAQMADTLVVESTICYQTTQQNARLGITHFIFKKAGSVKIAEGSSVLGICNQKYQLLYRFPVEVREYLHSQICHYTENPIPDLKIKRSKAVGLPNKR
ncbi:MAG: acyl-CoA thioesterase [Proteobacteria bacterium]|nr:acyl-CoA thioesterase [Pseudomonadota bacterium]